MEPWPGSLRSRNRSPPILRIMFRDRHSPSPCESKWLAAAEEAGQEKRGGDFASNSTQQMTTSAVALDYFFDAGGGRLHCGVECREVIGTKTNKSDTQQKQRNPFFSSFFYLKHEKRPPRGTVETGFSSRLRPCRSPCQSPR